MVSVLLVAFEPFDPIWWRCTSLKDSRLLWKWARKWGSVNELTEIKSKCGIDLCISLREWYNWDCWSCRGEGKGEQQLFQNQESPDSLGVWLSLETCVAAWHPAPQRVWHVAGPDHSWFMRKAQDCFRRDQEPSRQKAYAWELPVSQGLTAQVRKLAQEELTGAKLSKFSG